MKIREFKNEDVKELYHFEYIGKVYRGIDFNNYTYKYVAEESGMVIGFLYAGRSEDRKVILWELEVLEDYRHKGIATKLIDRLKKDMKKNNDNEIYLFYNKNTTLACFYEHLGFFVGKDLNVAFYSIEDYL